MPAGAKVLATCLLILALAAATRCCAEGDIDLINVRETHWGFDGTIVKKAYVPVAFLVQNNSPSTVTVTFEMTRLIGFGKPIGTVLKQDVTFSGESERWVQFTPYVEDELDAWTLKWGPQELHKMTLPQPQSGPRSTVLVYDREAVTPPPGPLRRMPEELLPASVTAMDGLRAMILDRHPRWQGARVRTFLDWLQRGGKVYIIQQENGQFPQFLEPLEILNRPQESYIVGAGSVHRVPRPLSQIDLDYARANIFNDQQTIRQRRPSQVSWDPLAFSATTIWDREYRVLSNLVSLARFKRNWLAIYLSAIAYLLVLWPGCYRIGTVGKDHRWFYLAFAAAIVVFSLLFVGLGRVGATIHNRTRAVAVARHLGDGAYDVTQWTTVAVTGGGTYRMKNQGSGFCYSNSNELESVLGTFDVGDDPYAEFFLPPSATRNVAHRCRLGTSRPAPILSRLEHQDVAVISVQFDTTGTWADNPEAAMLIWQEAIYPLKIAPGELQLDERGVSDSLANFLIEKPYDGGKLRGLPVWKTRPIDGEEDDRSERLIYEDMFLPMLSYACDARDLGGQLDVDLPDHVARLVVYARMPQEFFADGQTFPDQRGRVMFTFDYPVTAAP